MAKIAEVGVSFVLGIIAICALFIAQQQLSWHIGLYYPAISVGLVSIILGILAGYLIGYRFKQFFRDKIKVLLITNALWFGLFFSAAYEHIIWNYLNPYVALAVYISVSLFCLYLLLSLLAFNLFSTVTQPRNTLVSFIIGLLFGVLATMLVAFNFISLPWFVLCGTLLLILGFLFKTKGISDEIIYLSSLVAVFMVVYAVNPKVYAVEKIHERYMSLNHKQYHLDPLPLMLFSTKNTKADKDYSYIKLIKKIIYQDLDLSNKRVLVIGQGGYQLAKDNKAHIQFTFLNYMPDMLPSACTFMNLVSAGNQYFSSDSKLLLNSKNRYQVIIANVFPDGFVIPPELLSHEAMQKIRKKLTANGTAIINVVARPTLTDIYSKRVDNTIRAVFPSCMEIPMTYSNETTNIIYVCQKSDEESDDGIYGIEG